MLDTEGDGGTAVIAQSTSRSTLAETAPSFVRVTVR